MMTDEIIQREEPTTEAAKAYKRLLIKGYEKTRKKLKVKKEKREK